ncbi:MAG: arginine--tRNA ligase [Verrucomicrobia bacterium]|nr:arginine--tRNA ligase [Verrucomicrobiota bacterium]
MQNLITLLQHKASSAICEAFQDQISDPALLVAEVTQSTQAQFGHYQCNSALKIAKVLKMAPRAVAEKIVAHFDRTGIAPLEIAGPGFINISFEPSFLSKEVEALLADPRLGVATPSKIQRVIVEFSSPNIAKELHVGHLRSTIIGDALARLFEFLGHDVLRLNHIGDWGTQFGMLIAYMNAEVPDVLSGKVPADLMQLMEWYKESKKQFDADPEFKKRAQLLVVSLQSGDPATRKAWQMICDISRKAFQEIYERLDIKLVERGESFYNPDLPKVVSDLEKKGLITISDGAKCVFLEGFTSRDGTPLPMIVQKSDGGYNYDTTDIAALRHRVEQEKADRIIIVTDAGQSLHFEMLFKLGEKAHYYDPARVQLDHVPFGVVIGQDGKKFKTRSGDTVKLIDLLNEAVGHAEKILDEKLPDLSPAERRHTAEILGIDAIKYADLSCHRVKDYVFSYERMLKFEGNTAAFLLYSYVRILGIKRKVGKEIPKEGVIILEHPSEIALGLHLRQFGETLDAMARDLLPNRLTDYLYSLAEKFNAFFRDCRVEGSAEETSRLLLCEVSARILSQGLSILGLKTLDKM